MRKCDNPPPKYGGESCVGSDRQTMPCSLSDCPGKSDYLENKISSITKHFFPCSLTNPVYLFLVDGKWGLWSPWTSCSATCGAAKRSRTRECDHPPAAHGGKTCEGPEKQEEYCKLQPCLGRCLR